MFLLSDKWFGRWYCLVLQRNSLGGAHQQQPQQTPPTRGQEGSLLTHNKRPTTFDWCSSLHTKSEKIHLGLAMAMLGSEWHLFLTANFPEDALPFLLLVPFATTRPVPELPRVTRKRPFPASTHHVRAFFVDFRLRVFWTTPHHRPQRVHPRSPTGPRTPRPLEKR